MSCLLLFDVVCITGLYRDYVDKCLQQLPYAPAHVGHVIIVFVVSHLVFDWFIESPYGCASPKVEIAN